MLDSNTVIYARDGFEPVLEKFQQYDGSVKLSAIVLAELQRGFFKSGPEADSRRARLQGLLMTMPVLAFDANAARAYGRIIADCGWTRGRDFDRMIAAHAISAGATLVTDNTADFAAIPGLTLENWATP
ncbi:MAG: type II toxin-antitoxin system VapC family toxin [Rhizomicrobium sp.]